MQMIVPVYVKVSTYAESYDLHAHTVRKWIAAGLLETIRVGRCIRVRNAPPSDRRVPEPQSLGR